MGEESPAPQRPSPAPPPAAPQIPPELLLQLQREKGRSAGCLRWGVVGCAGVSVLLITGLLVLAMRAGDMLRSELQKTADEVLMRTAADVPLAERESFRKAVGPFADRAKEGAVPADRVQTFVSKSRAATRDGSVSAQELRELAGLLE